METAMEILELKKRLYEQCQTYLQNKITAAQSAIAEAQEAANQETKSSVGDKYETGRAMMQLEKDKYSAQLAETLKLQQALNQIDIHKIYDQVQPGALVSSSQGNFFIAVAAGKIEDYFVISLASPMGQILSQKKAGDKAIFRGKEISVFSVY